MKRICTAVAAVLLLASPLAVHAQSRGDHGGGGARGGGYGGGGYGGGASSDNGGGYQGGGYQGGGQRSAATGPSGAAGPASAAPAAGGYRGPGPGGYRGAPYRGYAGRYGYPGYYWGGLDLGFALGYSLAYPWYGDPYWGYGFYGPAYVYGPPPPGPYYDSPYDRDYGSSQPPAARDNGAACGTWVWNPSQSKYDWNTSACPGAAAQ